MRISDWSSDVCSSDLGPLSLRRLSKGIVMHIFVDYLLPFFALISAMVIIHEMGHYLAARMIGLHVTHFSVGMGPLLLSRADSRGCLRQICALPLEGHDNSRAVLRDRDGQKVINSVG